MTSHVIPAFSKELQVCWNPIVSKILVVMLVISSKRPRMGCVVSRHCHSR